MSALVTLPAEKKPCTLHRNHGSARPARTVGHHILPKEWGGDEHGDLAWTCDNGHYTVHRILDWMRKEYERMITATPKDAADLLQSKPPFGGSRSELALAREGMRRWLLAGRPK